MKFSYLISGLIFLALVLFAPGHVCAAGDEALSPHPTLAKSHVVLAAVTGMREFEKAYLQSSGVEVGDKFIGFRALSEGDEVSVNLYSLQNDSAVDKALFGCHLHMEADGSVESIHCDDEGAKVSHPYAPGKRNYVTTDFEAGAIAAIELFEKKIGNASLINEAKMWQTNGKLELSFKFKPDLSRPAFVMCHFHHGTEMDCHKQSRPGSNEPPN